MRVASFNICHGTRGEGTALDLPALVMACRSFDADVIALEEVDRFADGRSGPNQAKVVADALGLAWAWAPSRTRDRVTSGVALLVRGRIAGVEPIALRGHRRIGHRRDHRGALIALVDVAEQPFTVSVCHLSQDRQDSLAQQRLVLDALVARPGPHVFLGDLNRRTPWVKPEMDRHGLVLATDDVKSAPRTHPHFRIDHLAVGGLAIEAVRIVDAGTSDHRALVADLGVP